MNAIEIRNLCKNFNQKQALQGLNMTIPQGAIYGFIGENGSGKSTTEKIICGLLPLSSGSIKLFDKDYKDIDVRAQIGVLIESPGCFPNYSVWNNMMLQAANLGIKNAKEEVRKVLRLVHMEGSASNKYKNCSLGMKQRIGIAFALLGDPKLLILDEPINGLDADGMRIMREVLIDITKNGCTVLISSHILGELEKIATHYGIVRNGKMIVEMTAEELNKNCPSFVSLKAKDLEMTMAILKRKYVRVEKDEEDYIRIYDDVKAEDVVDYLFNEANIAVIEIKKSKINLEEYYIDLMKEDR